MKNKLFITIWGGIKIRMWKFVLGIIFGFAGGAFGFSVAVKYNSSEYSPLMTIFIVAGFTLITGFCGFIVPTVKYKTTPKDKSDSS